MTSQTPLAPTVSLRARMIEDMTLRGFGASTQRDYVRFVSVFADFLGRSPDSATVDDLRAYQLHQAQSGVQPPTINGSVSALRFFFSYTINRHDLSRHLIVVHQPRKLPSVLSIEEVTRLSAIMGCSPAATAKPTSPAPVSCLGHPSPWVMIRPISRPIHGANAPVAAATWSSSRPSRMS